LENFLQSSLIPVEIEKDLKISIVNSNWTECACLCEEIEGKKVIGSKIKERQIYVFQEQLIELEEGEEGVEDEQNEQVEALEEDNTSQPDTEAEEEALKPVLVASFTTYEYYNELEDSNFNNVFVCIDKVDTTGAIQDTKTSAIRQVIRAYLDYIKYIFDKDQILCYVFGRAQPQYLFVNSSEFENKKPLSDSQLCKWWKKTMSQSVCEVSGISKEDSRWKGLWTIPGFQPIQCRSMESNLIDSDVEWEWKIPYPLNESSEKVIPILPDDCKSRMIYDHEALSVKSLFEMIAIGEECGSGKRAGLFYLKKDSKSSEKGQTPVEDGNCTAEEFTQLLELLLEKLQFDDLYSIVDSSSQIYEWLEDHKINIKGSEAHVLIKSTIPNPTEVPITVNTGLNIKRKTDSEVNQLSPSMIKRKPETTVNTLSPTLIKRKTDVTVNELPLSLIKRKPNPNP
jgi:hypothetical protein